MRGCGGCTKQTETFSEQLSFYYGQVGTRPSSPGGSRARFKARIPNALTVVERRIPFRFPGYYYYYYYYYNTYYTVESGTIVHPSIAVHPSVTVVSPCRPVSGVSPRRNQCCVRDRDPCSSGVRDLLRRFSYVIAAGAHNLHHICLYRESPVVHLNVGISILVLRVFFFFF
jgi:hypothetical protein